MADRTVTAVLKADVSSFTASMARAKQATSDFSKNATDSAAKHKEAWNQVGTGMMVTGAVMAAGVGLAVKSFMDFDAAMSQAQAGTGATGASLDALRDAAIDMGAKTQFSATEAADAITAMGKAGVSTKDILGGGLVGALALAAAGQLDVGKAAEIAATAMNQFGLEGKDIPHIADLLAAGAGKAMGSVEDLAGALKYAGVVASDAGWSIEETTGVLAEFAQKGLLGEQAGTSLRGVLMSLEGPSAIAAKKMEELGINVYDAGGNFLKAAPLAQELHDKLGGLDEATRNAALGQIFGNEQITAARILYEGGGAAVQAWTQNVDDAGFAAKQAAMLTDNLKGDVERLGGSLSSVLIQAGSGANGMLRTMTQTLQGAVDLYGSAPVPIQQGATALGAVAAAALLVTGGMVTMIPKIAATQAALANMGSAGALMSRGMSAVGSALPVVGAALAVGVIGLGYFAHQAQETKARVDELATSLDQETGAITKSTAAMVTKKLSDDGSLDSARKMGIATGDLTNAYLGNTDAQNRVVAAAEAYSIAGGDAGDAMTNEATEARKLTDALGAGNSELAAAKAKTKALSAEQAAAIDPLTGLTGAQQAAADKIKATGDAAAAAKRPTQEQAQSEQDLAKAADAAKKAHDNLIASITNFGNAMLIARGDARGYEAAIDAAQEAVKKNGQTLDITTEKGRNNASALDAIASSALKAAQSSLENAEANGTLTTSAVTVTGQVNNARTAFINAAVSMGMNKTEAAKLATQAGLTAGRVGEITGKLIDLGNQKPNPTANANITPAQAKIKTLQGEINAIVQGKVPGLNADGRQGQAAIAALQRQIDALRDKTVTLYVDTIRTTINRVATGPGGTGGITKAGGGLLDGPGTGTSDSIPLWGSKGEYVVKAAAVQKYGVGFFDQANAMRFSAGGGVNTGPASSGGSSMVDMSGVRRDLAQQTAILRTLIPGFAGALDRQERSRQTHDLRMAGSR